MKKYLFLVNTLILSSILSAQTPSVFWGKNYGGTQNDRLYDGIATPDGGYLLTGSTISNDLDVSGNHGGDDWWVVKTDSEGNLEWKKCLGGSTDDVALGMSNDIDGNYIITGYATSSNGDLSGNHGLGDFWVVKLDTLGNILMQDHYGGAKVDHSHHIEPVPGGGYITAGNSRSTTIDVSGNYGSYDYWVVRLDASGNISWQKNLGGTASDIAYPIMPTNDGKFIMNGYTQSNNNDVSGNHGIGDYWIVELSNAGNIIWKKCLGGTGDDVGKEMAIADDGNYVFAGYTNSNDGDVSGNHGGYDFWIVKTDTSGNILWQKTYGGSNNELLYSLKKTIDGGFLAAGSSQSTDGDVTTNYGSSDSWVIKIDADGNLEWQKTIGGSDAEEARSAFLGSDGGFMVASFTESTDFDVTSTNGAYDFWLTKIVLSEEICDNGIDDDGNGLIDDGCTIPLTVTPGNDTTICKGSMLTLCANPATFDSYQWYKNGVIISGASSSCYNVSKAGSYSLQAVESSITYYSDTVTVTVVNKPNATITVLSDLDLCPTATAPLRANNGTGFSWQWYKNGAAITGATLRNYTATSTGNYKVKVTNSTGCFKVSPEVTVFATCKENAMQENNIVLSPNPNNGNFSLQLPQLNADAVLKIFSITGEKLFETNIAANENVQTKQVDLDSKLAEGIYILHLQTENERFTTYFEVIK